MPGCVGNRNLEVECTALVVGRHQLTCTGTSGALRGLLPDGPRPQQRGVCHCPGCACDKTFHLCALKRSTRRENHRTYNNQMQGRKRKGTRAKRIECTKHERYDALSSCLSKPRPMSLLVSCFLLLGSWILDLGSWLQTTHTTFHGFNTRRFHFSYCAIVT